MTASHLMNQFIALTRRQKQKEDRKERIPPPRARCSLTSASRRGARWTPLPARADVAKGTVYLYSKPKKNILAHLLLEGLDTLSQYLAVAFDEQAASSGEARLRRLAAAYYDFYQQEPDYFRLMMAFDRGQFPKSRSAPSCTR